LQHSLPAIAEYRSHARRTWYLYAVLAAGLLFAGTPMLIEPSRNCVEYPCPDWLRWTIFLIGLTFGGSAAHALIRKIEWGSRLNPQERTLVWWYGAAPAAEQFVDVDRIRTVRVDTSGDSDKITLIDPDGRTIYVPIDCFPAPFERWATTLVETFPHIQLSRA
jgi:hypothetical protein